MGRKLKARTFRSLWISRINAGARLYRLPYGRFVHGLAALDIRLNRKMLSELSVKEPYSFRSLVEQVKVMTAAPLTDFPQHGLVQSELVVHVHREGAEEAMSHRRRQAMQTRSFLEQHYAKQLDDRRSQQAQKVSVSDTANQQQQRSLS